MIALVVFIVAHERGNREQEMANKKKFIQAAIKRPGALHKALGVPQGDKIPLAKVKKAAKSSGRLGRQARFALTLRKFAKK